jgi:NADPH-dependent 2,4-dienoyl-CoA reductase/sulfur reductase-like enzyme
MRLVVVGGVAAGMSAAARARRLDATMEITVFEKGDTVSYGACGLPYFVEGRVKDWNQLVVHTAEYFRHERRIEVRTGAEVRSIEHHRRLVRLAGGEEVRYDKLVIATGARQDRRGIEGAEQPHVYSMNTIPEAIRLREYLRTARAGRATVIGAGYLGMEAIEALRTHGWKVRVVHGGRDFLRRGDGWLTETIEKHLARFGVEVRHGTRIKTVPSEGIVVLATGLTPHVELAQGGGVELGRTGAIRVSDRMETNLAGVYAAGDCAEAMHLVTERPAWIPLGTTANKMGRVAGAAAAGARERFAGIVGTAIVRVCGLGVGVTGLAETEARKEGFDPVAARVEALEKPHYFRGRKVQVELVANRRDGRLVGGAVIGDSGVEGRINVIATALTKKMTVEEFVDLDLAYAPPFSTVWDPLLIAAQNLNKLVH